jgi:hypothetical protein
MEALNERKLVVSELVDALGGGQILQAVQIQIVKRYPLEQRRRRLRHQHLATVPRRSDPRCAMHVPSDVTLTR